MIGRKIYLQNFLLKICTWMMWMMNYGLYLCSIVFIFPIKYCIARPLVFSIITYNSTIIACKHHTNNNPHLSNPKINWYWYRYDVRNFTRSKVVNLRRFVEWSETWTPLAGLGSPKDSYGMGYIIPKDMASLERLTGFPIFAGTWWIFAIFSV